MSSDDGLRDLSDRALLDRALDRAATSTDEGYRRLATNELTAKEWKFIEHYLISSDPTAAARAAGWTHAPEAAGLRALRRPRIAAALRQARDPRVVVGQMSLDMLIARAIDVALAPGASRSETLKALALIADLRGFRPSGRSRPTASGEAVALRSPPGQSPYVALVETLQASADAFSDEERAAWLARAQEEIRWIQRAIAVLRGHEITDEGASGETATAKAEAARGSHEESSA
jgi:hypothetical protein